jgi:uncharacterized membrane protein
MFGTFIVILGSFLILEVIRAKKSFNWRIAGETILWTGLIGLLAVIVLAVTAWTRQDIRGVVYRTVEDSGGLLKVNLSVLERREIGLVTEGVLIAAIFFVIGRLFSREPVTEEGIPAETHSIITYSPTTGFVLLLIAAGAVLALATDFVYLRDGFGYRINMVFKIYYQTWLLWSVASAYALWSIFSEEIPSRVGTILRPLFSIAAVIVIIAGLFYPVAAITSRAFKDGGHLDPNPPALTLDGAPSLAQGSDDLAAIQCLSSIAKSDTDVVAEAADHGIAYNNAYGRVSGLSGIPTVMGWENHEGQWRGDTYAAAFAYTTPSGTVSNRTDAVKALYNSTSWTDALPIIKTFGITYIYVGPTEKQEFGGGGGLAKFDALKPVCSSGEVAVYSTDSIGTQAPAPAGG